MLAAYLLVSPNGRVNPSLVSVATQLSDRRNVVPMVLAETLIGLDLVATGQTIIFGGSPLLLQVNSLSSPFSGFRTFYFYLTLG